MSTDHKYYRLFERGEIGFDSRKMSWAHWVAAALATLTGVIHLFLYWNQGFVAFLFAGVVFLGAVAALLLNVYRRLLYALGIPFTAGQIAIWAAQGMPDMGVAIFDKPIQLVLILVLGYLFVKEDELSSKP
jgi:hypothetical protein